MADMRDQMHSNDDDDDDDDDVLFLFEMSATKRRKKSSAQPPPAHDPEQQLGIPTPPSPNLAPGWTAAGDVSADAQDAAAAAAADDDDIVITREIVGASQEAAQANGAGGVTNPSTPSAGFVTPPAPNGAADHSAAEFVATPTAAATPATPATTARVTPSAASRNAGHAAARRLALAGNEPVLPRLRRLSSGATPNAQRAARRNPTPSTHSTRARRVSGGSNRREAIGGVRWLVGGDRHDAVGVGARRESTGGGSRDGGNPHGKVKVTKGKGTPDPPADPPAPPPNPTPASGGGEHYENVIDVLKRLQSPGNGLDRHLRRLDVEYWQGRVRWSALHRLAIELVRRQQQPGRGAVREVPAAITNDGWANAVTLPNGKRQRGHYLGFRSGDGNATLDRWVAQIDDLVCQALPSEADLDPSPDGTVCPDRHVQEQAQLLLGRVLVLWNQYLREQGRVDDGFIVQD